MLSLLVAMARDLLLSIALPVALLLLAWLAMKQWKHRLPGWLQRLSERPALLWNTGVGLIIGLSLVRWPLQR